MPELPEVETVKESLKLKLLGQKIEDTNIIYPKIIEYPVVSEWMGKIKGQVIRNISRRGKWLLFELDDYVLLSHLRMEGRYYFRDKKDPYEKHEHVVFHFEDFDLRYVDTRKFGRMHLIEKEQLYNRKPLNELGLEPFDENLTNQYLKQQYQKKSLPIKTVLLDQKIIVGIGNIYADEILYLSKINPLKKVSVLSKRELDKIIENTKLVLKEAIEKGGTTIKSYESSEGVHGRFQHQLLVHGKKNCPHCKKEIKKITIGGRGTYYCPTCQK